MYKPKLGEYQRQPRIDERHNKRPIRLGTTCFWGYCCLRWLWNHHLRRHDCHSHHDHRCHDHHHHPCQRHWFRAIFESRNGPRWPGSRQWPCVPVQSRGVRMTGAPPPGCRLGPFVFTDCRPIVFVLFFHEFISFRLSRPKLFVYCAESRAIQIFTYFVSPEFSSDWIIRCIRCVCLLFNNPS